jgi:hypothetical protein
MRQGTADTLLTAVARSRGRAACTQSTPAHRGICF